MSQRIWLFLSLVGGCLIAAAGLVYAQDFAIDWHTTDGGGAGPANASSGGGYALSGTIGQPDARNHPQPMTGGNYRLTGGFWVIPECPAIPCDFDGDCDVDQADFAFFEACASGPGMAQGDPACAEARLDADPDVDEDDFAVFQRCISGLDNPGDPTCAD